MTFQQKRRNAFAKLIERYQQTPDDYDAGEEEDPRPYLSGAEEIQRYVCVTQHDDKFFFLPTFAHSFTASRRAIEYIEDSIFNEWPVEVFDLDTATSLKPMWHTMDWA